MDVVDVPDANFLHQFLHADVFHVSYQPFAHIRKLTFAIDVDRTSQIGEDEKPHILKADLKEDLGPLLKVAEKRIFDLHIQIKQRRLYLGTLDETLEIIKPVYCTFKDGGANVTVEHQYTPMAYSSDNHGLKTLDHLLESRSDT